MKRLTGAFLILCTFASTALAQSAEQVMKDRRRVFGGWLGTVRRAELKYKSKYGVYGDLTALRTAHLLDTLVFESDKPAEAGPDTNFVPQSTHFEVTSSNDGEHYKASISEDIFGEWGIGVFADEKSAGYSVGHRRSPPPEQTTPAFPPLELGSRSRGSEYGSTHSAHQEDPCLNALVQFFLSSEASGQGTRCNWCSRGAPSRKSQSANVACEKVKLVVPERASVTLTIRKDAPYV